MGKLNNDCFIMGKLNNDCFIMGKLYNENTIISPLQKKKKKTGKFSLLMSSVVNIY